MKRIIWIICIVLVLTGCENNHQTNQSYQKKNDKESEQMELTLTVFNQDFIIQLENNEATHLLLENLPMTVTMEDLHHNEKFVYTNMSFPTQSESVEQIEAGDFMLFGNNCLVLFYKNFTTPYQYTRLGKVKNSELFTKLISQHQQINIKLHQ